MTTQEHHPKDFNDIIKQLWKYLWKHKLIILSITALFYLIFYSVYSFNHNLKGYLKEHEDLIKYLSQVSILFFTSGLFAASLKYLQLLDVFKIQFSNYIESSQFDEKLKNNLKLITFSEEYLTQQSDLQTLWNRITLCFYKKEFPSIYDKISNKIKNDFFIKSNITYYYKNFQTTYELTKDSETSIKTIERSSYTIVRPNEEEFSWDFGYSGHKDDSHKEKIQFKIDIKTTNQKIEANFNNAQEVDENFTIKITSRLSGHTEYHIERYIETIQDINLDRIRVFGSDRIIDDLSFKVTSDEFVKTTVHFLGNNKFTHNGAFSDKEIAYSNRDVLLPGQKFLIVFTL